MPNENFLEELEFFLPTSGLAKRLFSAVEEVSSRELQNALKDREQVEDDDYLNNLPPEEIEPVAAIASPVSEQLSGRGKPVSQGPEQRFIAEELYHHLAFLARNPSDKEHRRLSIKENVAYDMGAILGLPKQEPLLMELANEFSKWLNRAGHFTTGWGNIILAEENHFYLEAFELQEDDAVSSKQRTLIPRLAESKRRASTAPQAKGVGKSGGNDW